MQNSEFAYFSSKSGKHMKQKSTPPFWGDAVMKKWSPFLIRGCRSCGVVEVVGVVGDVGLGVVVVVVEVRRYNLCNLGNAMARNMKIWPGRNPYGLVLVQSAQLCRKMSFLHCDNVPQSPCKCGG